jgi:hypothetical protein
MAKLIELLENQTESFKAQFLEITKDWAGEYFEVVAPRRNFSEVEWCNVLGIEPGINRLSQGQLGFPNNFYNSGKSKVYSKLRDEAYKLTGIGKESFIAKELEKAEKHFKASLEKLALRIQKKELNIETMEVQSAHVGVNLEITFTDGDKTVRAFTIIASGEVQRPHYRYLIK